MNKRTDSAPNRDPKLQKATSIALATDKAARQAKQKVDAARSQVKHVRQGLKAAKQGLKAAKKAAKRAAKDAKRARKALQNHLDRAAKLRKKVRQRASARTLAPQGATITARPTREKPAVAG